MSPSDKSQEGYRSPLMIPRLDDELQLSSNTKLVRRFASFALGTPRLEKGGSDDARSVDKPFKKALRLTPIMEVFADLELSSSKKRSKDDFRLASKESVA
jgi:hypothetical protein